MKRKVMKDWECVTWFGDSDEVECGLFTAALRFPLLETPFSTLLLPINYQLNGRHDVIIV
ncbi:hypothetical protein ACIQWQ_24765 [Peribacillus frigoritolerans]